MRDCYQQNRQTFNTSFDSRFVGQHKRYRLSRLSAMVKVIIAEPVNGYDNRSTVKWRTVFHSGVVWWGWVWKYWLVSNFLHGGFRGKCNKTGHGSSILFQNIIWIVFPIMQFYPPPAEKRLERLTSCQQLRLWKMMYMQRSTDVKSWCRSWKGNWTSEIYQ